MAKRKEGPSKMGLVRQALEKGIDENEAIAAFVKEHGGGEMTPQAVSTYKSQIKARGKSKGKGKQRLELSERGKALAAGVESGTVFMAELGNLTSLIGKEGVKKLVDSL